MKSYPKQMTTDLLIFYADMVLKSISILDTVMSLIKFIINFMLVYLPSFKSVISFLPPRL